MSNFVVLWFCFRCMPMPQWSSLPICPHPDVKLPHRVITLSCPNTFHAHTHFSRMKTPSLHAHFIYTGVCFSKGSGYFIFITTLYLADVLSTVSIRAVAGHLKIMVLVCLWCTCLDGRPALWHLTDFGVSINFPFLPPNNCLPKCTFQGSI